MVEKEITKEEQQALQKILMDAVKQTDTSSAIIE